MDMKTETLYKLQLAANLLSVHQRTLKRWNEQGKIHLVQLPNGDYRISGSELQRILTEHPAEDQTDRTEA